MHTYALRRLLKKNYINKLRKHQGNNNEEKTQKDRFIVDIQPSGSK